MAITYPRTLPSFVKSVDTMLDPIVLTSGSRTRGGSTQSYRTADPYWSLQITTQPLSWPQKAELKAWWDSLEGGRGSFLAYDHFAQWPEAYATEAAVLALTRAGGGAFDGTASITSFSTVRAIGLSSDGALRLPANFAVLPGDYVSIVKAGSPNRYSLHRVTEAATANGSGVISALFVSPIIKTNIFAVGDTVNFIRASGEFIPDQERWSGTQTVQPSAVTIAGFSKI